MANKRLREVQGQKALITGASSGIGKEYARQLAERGYDLVIAARRLNHLQTLATTLRETYSVTIQCIQIDLTTPRAAESLFSQATQDKNPITVLINCAGVGKYGSFVDFTLEEHRSIFNLNAGAPTELTYLTLKHMLEHKLPSYMTQVASIAAFQPVGNFTVYSGTKGYLRYFSETLAYELRRSNVSMTCLCPGGTYTEFFEHSGQKITPMGHLTMMSCEKVVTLGLKAMFQKKHLCIPGFLNQLSCFLPRLFPRKLALHLAYLTMNRAVEKIPHQIVTPEAGTKVSSVISEG